MLSFAFNIKPAKGEWAGTVYIRADGSIDPPDASITTYDNITYTLTDNITSSADGIVVERDNIIIDGNGFTLQGSGVVDSKGIDISGRYNVTIKNTNIQNFDYGIGVHYSSNNGIIGNSITINNVGIHVINSSSCVILENTIANNRGSGISMKYASHVIIFNNSISENAYYYVSGGIKIDTSMNVNVQHNNLINNQWGGAIYLYDSTNVTVKENLLFGKEGVYLGSSSRNYFYHNNFYCDLPVDVFSSPDNIWDDGYPSGGNYWSNYMGVDFYSGQYQNETEHDGIGDAPFIIDESNKDNYPLMNPWGPVQPEFLGTVYIREDGGVYPPGAPIITYDKISYFLTGNITSHGDGVVIGKDGIILDGNGCRIHGPDLFPIAGISLIRRQNVTVRNVQITGFYYGIIVDGVFSVFPTNCSIYNNTITTNNYGVWLRLVCDTVITINNITTIGYSINLWLSTRNTISNNIVGGRGITLWESSDNIIARNNANRIGLLLDSTYNIIVENNISSLYVDDSSNNKFYHNSFLNDVSCYDSVNVWDDGYPSGGNYWSDYRKKYPNAKELGGSGLWDTPYVIDENNRDRYPLMYPYGTETYKLTITTTFGGTTNPSPGTHTYAKGTIAEVTAIPDVNYTFSYWELDGLNVGSDNPIEVLMDLNHTLYAVFTLIPYYELTISTTTGGTTNPAPGIYTYVNGTQVVITAISYNGFSFDYWLLDGVKITQNPITIIMNANHTLEAYFVDDIPPEISDPWQDPPPNNVQPLQNVTVRVNVTDYGTGIKNVTLWYSLDNGTSWTILNMTALPVPSNTWITYEATIDGYENCTWVTYKIIAYDNAGNNATKDNNGYGYKYHVIPEFPSTIVSLLLLMLIAISLIFIKQRFFRIEKREV
jgi:parallel beta-helix repeat protein